LSDLLTNAAPSTDDGAAPVGEIDAAASGEVDSGSSAQPEGFIPKERFDGLMSSFNKAQAEAQAKAEEVSALEARLAILEAQLTKPEPQENEVADSDTISRLEAQIAQLTELVGSVANRSLESDMEAVWSEFPEATPFKDLFVANTPEDLRETVAAFTERLRAVTAPAEAPAPQEQAPAPAASAPQGAGGVAISTDAQAPTAALRDAIANRDVAGYLKAKAQVEFGDEGGVALSPTS
jgi:hypothetical protein